MKKVMFYPLILLILTVGHANIFAGEPDTNKSLNDSSTNSLKLNKLKKEKEQIVNQIKIEDAKRNRQVAGVNEETLEIMNDRQDSICLALRSRLVDINIEIKALTPAVVSPGLINQYNNLVNANKPSKSEKKSSAEK